MKPVFMTAEQLGIAQCQVCMNRVRLRTFLQAIITIFIRTELSKHVVYILFYYKDLLRMRPAGVNILPENVKLFSPMLP